MTYDPNNIFARILRQEIPCKKISEDNYYLAFHDLYPKAPIHILIIPKGPFKDALDFNLHADAEAIAGFHKGIAHVIQTFNWQEGYRLVSNSGEFGNQEVSHYHVHLLGGKQLGPILTLENKG